MSKIEAIYGRPAMMDYFQNGALLTYNTTKIRLPYPVDTSKTIWPIAQHKNIKSHTKLDYQSLTHQSFYLNGEKEIKNIA